MKKVALVHCEEALIGRYSPISFLTEANLLKAVGMIENGTCDLVYIPIDHFGVSEKEAALAYLNRFKNFHSSDFQEKIVISASSMNYTAMFIRHIMSYSSEISLSILGKACDRIIIANDINYVIDGIDVVLDKLNIDLENLVGKKFTMPRIWIS